MTEQLPGLAGDVRQGLGQVERTQQDPVLGDVGRVVVVRDLKRHGQSEAPADVSAGTDPAADHGQGIFVVHVPMEDATAKDPVGDAGQ